MRVHFTNLGCKLNQAELEALARRFLAAGHVLARSLEDADLHVVNSCTVTHIAARDSRKVARRGARSQPGLRTVLTGCHVDADPEEAAALSGVDLVVPNADKERLLERVHERFPEEVPLAAAAAAIEGGLPPCGPTSFGNSRALVKIEDGCNMRCSFCIIPTTRGRQTSRPPEEVVQEVSDLVAAGFHEVIFTGVQISSYRHGALGLFELVRRVLAETDLPRLRLTSIAPWQFDPRLDGLFSTGRVCRHVHLSLQSGSPATLRRMRRPYSPGEFRDLVTRLRDRVPELAVTTDVIVGFPGEDESEFEASLEFVSAIGFSRVHVFPFSPRAGTEAATMAGQLPHSIRRARVKRMLAVATRSELAFRHRCLGREAEVLWESRRDGRWRGTTDNYLRAFGEQSADLAGRATRGRIAAIEPDGVFVEIGTDGIRDAAQPARSSSSLA